MVPHPHLLRGGCPALEDATLEQVENSRVQKTIFLIQSFPHPAISCRRLFQQPAEVETGGTSMVDFDRSLLGRLFETARPVEITAEMIAQFCTMIGETKPNPDTLDADQNQSIAPPAFVASFRALEDIFDYLPKHLPRLAAGMDIEFGQPIKAGDAISISSELAETYSKTGRSGMMTFFVIRSILTNQHGEIVARIDHRFTYRG
jgi:acyl dehydratase